MIHRPLLVLFTLLKYVFSVQLDEALLFDMFPQPSDACLSRHEIDPEETQTSYTFTHSTSESSWHQNAEPYEQQNFLAEMTSASNDSDRSWKIRIGQSGNMYSLRGELLSEQINLFIIPKKRTITLINQTSKLWCIFHAQVFMERQYLLNSIPKGSLLTRLVWLFV